MRVQKFLISGLLLATTMGISASAMAATINYKSATYEGQVSVYNNNGKKVRMPAGHGTMTYNTGAVYKGLFSKGRFHGRGTLHFAKGGYCAAHFEHGKMQGGADCRYANGNKYVGNMNQGKRHGSGLMTYSDGARYHGSWKNGRPHGSGDKTYANGNSYAGQWKNGKREGEGIYRFRSGTYFSGFWKDSKKHGPLEYFNPEKKMRLCTLFNNGEKVRAVRHSGTRGSCYDLARSW